MSLLKRGLAEGALVGSRQDEKMKKMRKAQKRRRFGCIVLAAQVPKMEILADI
jgi:hypothetical protein